jgi:hypothetical protein
VFSQIVPNVGYQRPDRFYRFVELGGGLAYFPRPMPHFGRRVDVDALWIGGTLQLTVIVNGSHRSKTVTPVATTSRPGTTTGRINQANI